MRRSLPALRVDKNACDSQEVFILGAGASRATCPDGDAQGRRLPLMAGLVTTVGLEEVLAGASVSWKDRNFEDLYQAIQEDTVVAGAVEAAIHEYLKRLELPSQATFYDRLVLSLRPKDYIATFNWDPLLVQAYSRNRGVAPLPQLLFLHGNVAVGACVQHRQKGFIAEHRCGVCEKPLSPTRLLYPIAAKGYDADPFIAQEWEAARQIVSTAYLFTVVGYSAPRSDVEARRILLESWQANPLRDLAEVDIVDIQPPALLEQNWKEFFVRTHYSTSADPRWLFARPRRSCDHFAMATLQQRPCRERRLPDTTDLAELQSWVKPLVDEEFALEHEGIAFPC